ncbi:fibrobacter succinogenes major paralogous domain-containing protein [Pedobacter sp. SYSU D00535]|uniref:fibrobacter succinogenes major paralogous domain-containing protein n=1 Tax=Pedobacter sp. SYSU D00535 TaxID=2810308 RepID=UPI001F6250FE|nr:fibrobacter succinogenes major paralogous domain-containing protein [Pedobacter sp. SYSU D00535]
MRLQSEKVRRKFVLLSIAVLFVVACKHDDNSVTDVDGNRYKTVVIGDQIWMAENLRVTRYRNGDPILNIMSNNEWSTTTTGAFCYYGNDSINARPYGLLYNWYAINDSRNIAPEGWHVPTPEELNTLINYLKGDTVAAGKLKETGQKHWISNIGASNEIGFSARPGGYRFKTGSFHTLGSNGYWWTNILSFEMFSWSKRIFQGFADVDRIEAFMNYGFSLRCIKDKE